MVACIARLATDGRDLCSLPISHPAGRIRAGSFCWTAFRSPFRLVSLVLLCRPDSSVGGVRQAAEVLLARLLVSVVEVCKGGSMLDFADYVDVEARREQLRLRFPEGVVLLPRGFVGVGDASELLVESDAVDIAKLLRQQGLGAGIATMDEGRLPVVVERDSFVRLPDLLLQVMSSAVLSIVLNVVGNYVYDKLVGTFEKPDVRLTVVVRDREGTYKRVVYEGPVDGLNSLQGAVESIVGHDE